MSKMNSKIQDNDDDDKYTTTTTRIMNTEVNTNEENLKKNFKFRNLFLFVFTLSISILIGYLQISLFNEATKKGSKELFKEVNVDSTDESHTWFIINDIFNEKFLKDLNELVKTSTLSTINGESTLLNGLMESAGEAVPVGHSDCDHPFMSVNHNRSLCHIAQRIDVGNHFISTGGFNSNMESYEKMIARMLVFHKKLISILKQHNLDGYLNDHEKFLKYAKDVCKNQNPGKNFDSLVLDLFHIDLVVLIEGQEIPMHVDVPYFFGADRTTLPQWLLVMMKQSGLFDDLFVADLKGVSWLSDHKNKPDADGGHFYMYPYKKSDIKETDGVENKNDETNKKNDYIMFESIYNRVILFDGTSVIHGK